MASELRQNFIDSFSNLEVTMSIMVGVGVAGFTILVVLFCGIWKWRVKVLPSQSEAPKKPRFRKREKIMFYGRKMLRKVRSFTKNTIGTAGGGRQRGKRKMVLKLAKRILQMRRESSQPVLHVKEPPSSFFEADSSEFEDSDHRLPPEVLYMLKSVRVFGHFEKPLFLELCKYMESKFIPAGQMLFKIGDDDDSIYVVQNGKLQLTITESGKEIAVKEVETGHSIYSLLSILDCLTGHPKPYKTVTARAIFDSTVLRLPAQAFLSMFERFPESIVRVVQIIMVRLQRVTFMALHNYLGLSSELMNPYSQTDLKSLSIHTLSSHASPRKRSSSIDTGIPPEEGEKEKQFNKPRSASITKGKSMEESGVGSDFDRACLQARVPTSSVSVGSPSRQQYDDTLPTSRQRFKKSHAIMEQGSSHGDVDEKQILELATKDLISILNLKDESLLNGKLFLKIFKAGKILVKQADQDSQLIFIVTGSLYVLQQIVGEEDKEALLSCAQPGEIVGSLAVLTGESSFFTIKAKTDVRVVTISKEDFYKIMREQPSVVLSVAHCTVARITPFVRQIDFALDWTSLEAGKALFKQGEYSDFVYIVLTGRLRSVVRHDSGKKHMTGEFGRGEIVGIVEILTQTERATSVMAIRDTELAKMPAELLNLIKKRYPQVVTRLIHLLGQRILGSLQPRNPLPYSDYFNVDSKSSVDNLSTIAVIPASNDVPIANFTLELQHALNSIGTTSRLTSEVVKTRLGSSALDSVNEFRLYSWMGQQEDIHRMVLYQCDFTLSKWTKICIRQADCILIVGVAENEPKVVGEVEKQLESIAVRAQKELILLHQETADYPRHTVEWLNARGWCSSHHHIKCPKRVFSKKSAERSMSQYEELFRMPADRHSDFSRLARFLTGTSIGLVLGGGGARGISQIGMIRAMNEVGIPIDYVGGVSIGSFMGALWCEERDLAKVTHRAGLFSKDMGTLVPKVLDLTYPVASMFKGAAFNRAIENIFKDKCIEDLWIPYFCITTDITLSAMRVHSHGSLWRYVRASMSLSGYLPPLCDPVDGHLLLDGGYVNNLPADVMRGFGCQHVFAIDVGSVDDTKLTNYGDELSGWWLLWKRWNPWASPVRVPDLTEIQSRLAYVSCNKQMEVVKNSEYCEYIRPPIDKYRTLQFNSFDEILEVGYHHGKTFFSGWVKGGLVEKLFEEKTEDKDKSKLKAKNKPNVPVMAYFTDLAEQVSKIEPPRTRAKKAFYISGDDTDSDISDIWDEEVLGDEDMMDDDMMDDDDVIDENDEYNTEEMNEMEDDENKDDDNVEVIAKSDEKPAEADSTVRQRNPEKEKK